MNKEAPAILTRSQKIRRLALVGSALLAFAIVAVFCYKLSQVFHAMRMRNEQVQEVRSPDGRYVATIAYSDGPTFGYYFVCVQFARSWKPLQEDDAIPNDEIAEVAAEGLGSIAWKSNHELMIDYDATNSDDKAEFTLQRKTWRDVAIVYHAL